MSSLGHKRTSGCEVRHASFDDVGLSLGARCIGMHRERKENSDGQVGRRMDIRLGQIQPRRSRAKMRQFSARASIPRGSREKRPCYPLRCSRSVASAAIRINPTTPRVMAASRSANAALGHKRTTAIGHVRFTPKSGHMWCNHGCPLRIGHSSFTQSPSLRRLRKCRPGARRYESGDQLLVVALKVSPA